MLGEGSGKSYEFEMKDDSTHAGVDGAVTHHERWEDISEGGKTTPMLVRVKEPKRRRRYTSILQKMSWGRPRMSKSGFGETCAKYEASFFQCHHRKHIACLKMIMISTVFRLDELDNNPWRCKDNCSEDKRRPKGISSCIPHKFTADDDASYRPTSLVCSCSSCRGHHLIEARTWHH